MITVPCGTASGRSARHSYHSLRNTARLDIKTIYRNLVESITIYRDRLQRAVRYRTIYVLSNILKRGKDGFRGSSTYSTMFDYASTMYSSTHANVYLSRLERNISICTTEGNGLNRWRILPMFTVGTGVFF